MVRFDTDLVAGIWLPKPLAPIGVFQILTVLFQ